MSDKFDIKEISLIKITKKVVDGKVVVSGYQNI